LGIGGTMDYGKLYAPYSTLEAPSPVDQIKWLTQNKIPDNIIEQAMMSVYEEVSRGRVFEATKDHNATHVFWMYLLDVARKLHGDEVDLKVNHLQEFHGKLKMQTTFDLTEQHKKELLEHQTKLEDLNKQMLDHLAKVAEYHAWYIAKADELNKKLADQLQIEAEWNALTKTKKIMEVLKGNA